MVNDMGRSDAEVIFGFKPGTVYNENTVKKTYRRLVKENHPDAVRSKGIDQETANDRMSEINKAYTILERAVTGGQSVTADGTPKTSFERDEEQMVEDFAEFFRNMANGAYNTPPREETWFDKMERERRESQEKAREEQARQREKENARDMREAAYARNSAEVGRVYDWSGTPVDLDPTEREAAEAAREVAKEAYMAVKIRDGATPSKNNGGGYAKQSGKASKPSLFARAIRGIVNCEVLWRAGFLLIGLWIFNQSAMGGDAFLADNQLIALVIMMVSIANLIFGFITRPIRKALVSVIDAIIDN